MKKIEKFYKIILKKYLMSKSRIQHSISTALMMHEYAPVYGLDPEKAFCAGLYHDLAKELPDAPMIELALKFKDRELVRLQYLDFKIKYPFLLHGVASAEIMLNDLNITDREILEAACFHTQGGENISRLSQFTFMADFSEPLRKYPPSNKVNKMLTKEKDFNKAYYYSYVFLLKSLLKKQKIICPESLDGYNQALKMWLGF